MIPYTDHGSYMRNRRIPQWLAHLRKFLSLPARFVLGWQIRRFCFRCMGAHFGRNSYVGRDCLFDEEATELIEIGDDVTISSRVIIVTHDVCRHVVAPVQIRNNAFIGIGSIIMPGVVVGENSVVAAGAVVTRSVEPNTIVGGSPARFIKQVEGVLTHRPS